MMKNISYHRYSLIFSALILTSVCQVQAQGVPELPRVVVNIMVDQLRTDYMEAFMPLYCNTGIRRLVGEGRYYTQVEYPFANPDRASATACMASGASPYDNGIPSQKWLDRKTLRPVYCVDDSKFAGQETSECTSPRYLAVSTLGDELKVATEGKGVVISIAPFRDASCLSAGHAADACYWINDSTGKWCSSSYYGYFPKWVSTYNNVSAPSQRIDDIVWEPSNQLVGEFSYFISGGIRKPFSHKFKGDRAFVELKASGMINNEVNRFVLQALQEYNIGSDAVTDLLNVTYYAGGYDHRSEAECPMELQDTYVRLDAAISEIIQKVEQRVGKNHALFVLTGTGYSDEPSATDMTRYRIPTGIFDMSKAQMLLNMYLIAVYGQGQWVESTLGNQIYLNLSLIEQRNVNLSEMLSRCSAFLIQLSGVKDIYTSQRLSLGAWTPGISKLRNAYNPHCSGDIMVQVSPGWVLANSANHEQKISRESYISFPLFFLGCNIKSEKIQTVVTIDQVAPTITQALRIRAPNGCSKHPL